jgi:hypothetical protein
MWKNTKQFGNRPVDVLYVRLQPLLPICKGALQTWRQSTLGRNGIVRACCCDVDGNAQVWADAPLLQKAIVSLLGYVSHFCDEDSPVSLTMSAIWKSRGGIKISFTMKKAEMIDGPPGLGGNSTIRNGFSEACGIIEKQGGTVKYVYDPPLGNIIVGLLCGY